MTAESARVVPREAPRDETREWPRVSIVIPTLDCAALLEQCLAAVATQDYPRDRLEVLVLDGGSVDGTQEVGRRFGATVIVADQYRENAEPRMGLGVERATGDVVAFVMSDNLMPDPGWLRSMVRPLVDDPSLAGSQTLRYRYRPGDSLMTRYFALLGASDTVAYYLDRRDRVSWMESGRDLPGEIADRGDYYAVRFTLENLPPMGCNGSLLRRELLLQTGYRPGAFGHSDVVADMVAAGHDTFAVVKNDIVHLYGSSARAEVRKRLRYFRTLHPSWGHERRYLVYDPRRRGDRARLARTVLITLTVVRPLADALRGYRRVRDRAWFVHPWYAFAMTSAYGWAMTRRWGERARARSVGYIRRSGGAGDGGRSPD